MFWVVYFMEGARLRARVFGTITPMLDYMDAVADRHAASGLACPEFHIKRSRS